MKSEKLLLATNLSSQAIAAYPTTKDTMVAMSVLPHPTPSAM